MKKLVSIVLIFVMSFSALGTVFGENIENNSNTLSKKQLMKQLITSKVTLQKSKTMNRYVKKIDVLTDKLSYKKLQKLRNRLGKIPEKSRNNKKYKVFFDYLEAKILLKIDLVESREQKNNSGNKKVQYEIIHVFGNGVKLEQSPESTYLTNKGKIVYTWKHESKTNPYIWDEACAPVWKEYEIHGNQDKQGIWDRLTDEERRSCLKEDYKRKIGVSKTTHVDYVIFYKAHYETRTTHVLNLKTNHIIALEFYENVNQIMDYKNGTILMYSRYETVYSRVILNDGKESIELFKNSNDNIEINNPDYKEIQNFSLVSENQIQINYKGQNGVGKKEIIDLR
ncbi:MAG: hypothetical protein GY828_03385 [Candidatus Gracilibacteria bacterium]|nr:hypothetical protein [Candidatus Gracilibacteria bacterium]